MNLLGINQVLLLLYMMLLINFNAISFIGLLEKGVYC